MDGWKAKLNKLGVDHVKYAEHDSSKVAGYKGEELVEIREGGG